MVTKRDWRARAVVARAGVRIDSERHCEALARFLASPVVGDGWVVGYQAMGDEVDLAPLYARRELGPFAVTRTPDAGLHLTVHPLDSPDERHRYGFRQPVADAPTVADDEIAVVLVPGLAFDRLGTRLGRGKGYYDRFLARLGPDLVRVGITGGYVVAELPTEAHDVAMTHLAGDGWVAAVPLDEPPEGDGPAPGA
jgi:5-formyltetrahydrofolate cyclo-ligase